MGRKIHPGLLNIKALSQKSMSCSSLGAESVFWKESLYTYFFLDNLLPPTAGHSWQQDTELELLLDLLWQSLSFNSYNRCNCSLINVSNGSSDNFLLPTPPIHIAKHGICKLPHLPMGLCEGL